MVLLVNHIPYSFMPLTNGEHYNFLIKVILRLILIPSVSHWFEGLILLICLLQSAGVWLKGTIYCVAVNIFCNSANLVWFVKHEKI